MGGRQAAEAARPGALGDTRCGLTADIKAAAAARPRILLAVHDVVSGSVLRPALQAGGFELDVCENGRDVLHLYEARKPALVILEEELPGLDVQEVCARLRKLGGIPIIVLMGVTSTYADASRFTGADDFLFRPFDSGQLLTKIWAADRRQKRHGQVPSGTRAAA